MRLAGKVYTALQAGIFQAGGENGPPDLSSRWYFYTLFVLHFFRFEEKPHNDFDSWFAFVSLARGLAPSCFKMRIRQMIDDKLLSTTFGDSVYGFQLLRRKY
jgi:hypothetical protein